MRRALRPNLALSLVVFVVALFSSMLDASAQTPPVPCGQTDQTWVNVRFIGHGWSQKLIDSVMAELKADLSRDDIAACVDAISAILPPVAVVEIGADDPDTVVITIQVRDKVTAKRVARDADLGALPADGRPLAVAAAADELLRATWAELALRKAPPPAIEPPAAVLRAARETLPAPPKTTLPLELGARFAVVHYGGGQTAFGPDAFVRIPIAQRFASELSIGGRNALTAQSAHGTIRSHAMTGSLAGVFTLFRSAPMRLSVGAGIRATSVAFEASATSAAEPTSATAMTFSGYGLAQGSFQLLSSLRFCLGAGMGVPFRSATATDDGLSVTGVGGVEVFGNAGLSFDL